MSLDELAKITGLSYATVWRKINAESREFTLGDLSKIAAALNISLVSLLTRAEEAEERKAGK